MNMGKIFKNKFLCEVLDLIKSGEVRFKEKIFLVRAEEDREVAM